jgi:hypothetical protein
VIDVIIPAHEKDVHTLDLCINAVRKYVEGVQNVYVISKAKLTDSAIWYPEENLPFSIADVADKIGAHWRTSWYYADLLEGYASVLVDGPSDYTLILDADTIFLQPVSLIEDGKALLNSSPADGTAPYYEYISKIIPGLHRQHYESGVAHWILQEKFIVKKMVETVENIHKKQFWEAALDVTCQKYEYLWPFRHPSTGDNNHETCPGKMANFELYFTYALKNYPDRVNVKKQNSIMAYKGSLGLPGPFQKSELSRTNTRGNVKILTDEEESKINEMNFSSLPPALSHICKLCSQKGWTTVTFQCHFWVNSIEDYQKLNDKYIKSVV